MFFKGALKTAILCSIIFHVTSKLCQECEEEIWEEIPCNAVTQEDTLSSTMAPQQKYETPKAVHRAAYSMISSVSENPNNTPYKDCRCDCKSECKHLGKNEKKLFDSLRTRRPENLQIEPTQDRKYVSPESIPHQSFDEPGNDSEKTAKLTAEEYIPKPPANLYTNINTYSQPNIEDLGFSTEEINKLLQSDSSFSNSILGLSSASSDTKYKLGAGAEANGGNNNYLHRVKQMNTRLINNQNNLMSRNFFELASSTIRPKKYITPTLKSSELDPEIDTYLRNFVYLPHQTKE